jgi:hypothetical protein
MLNFESKRGKVSVEVEGNVIDIVSDVCVCIGALYERLSKDNDGVAEYYKSAIKSAVADEIMFKIEEKEDEEEKKEEDEDIVDDLFKLLKKLAK